MKNFFEYILFLSFSFFCRIFGLRLSRKFASVIGFIFFYFIPIRRKVVIDNLQNAFPELTENEIKKLAYNNFKNFALTLVEILILPGLDDKDLKNIVSFDEIEKLKQLYDLGNGVILLSAHFGNWEYGALSIALNIEKKIFVVAKAQRNTQVNNWIDKQREKCGNEVIPLGISIRNVYSALKEKKIVALVADQRGPAESIKLEFFGRKTSVYTGPAVLSLKTNSPIIYGLTIRQKDLSYKAVFKEISRENLPDNNDEKVKVLSERILIYLENVIREYPEQWFWMHKRWKH